MQRPLRPTGKPGWLGCAHPATGAILVAMVLVTFAPTLRNQYIWDDDAYVTKNLNLRSAEGLWATWFKPFSLPQYYPLVHTTFWLEYQSWELDPVGYHVDNMLLHALGVVLAWRVLLRLGISWAWLGAALFAVHPVTVESVAWITERKNVLSEALVLASMLCYLRFAPVEPNSVDATGSRWKWINYGLALVFFLGALLSKTVVATMPAVLLVIYWWKRGRIGWRDLVPLLPFFAVGMSLGMVTAWLERIHVGAEGDEWAFTRAERVLIAGRAVWFYATKLAWPHPIIFFYPRWEIDGHEWWQYCFPRRRWRLPSRCSCCVEESGRGPLAAALVFGGVLVPAIGFFNVYPFRFSFVADHFQHHATLSLFALAAGGAALLDRRLARVNVATGETPTNTTSVSFAPSQILLRGVTGVVLVVLAVTSYVQCRTYYDVEVLYTDVMAKNPSAWIAFSNLGAHYLKEQRGEEATALLRQALAICAAQFTDPRQLRPRDVQQGSARGLSARTTRGLHRTLRNRFDARATAGAGAGCTGPGHDSPGSRRRGQATTELSSRATTLQHLRTRVHGLDPDRRKTMGRGARLFRTCFGIQPQLG